MTHRPTRVTAVAATVGLFQGKAFAGSLAQRSARVFAMSRFGQLRTPMPRARISAM